MRGTRGVGSVCLLVVCLLVPGPPFGWGWVVVWWVGGGWVAWHAVGVWGSAPLGPGLRLPRECVWWARVWVGWL